MVKITAKSCIVSICGGYYAGIIEYKSKKELAAKLLYVINKNSKLNHKKLSKNWYAGEIDIIEDDEHILFYWTIVDKF